MKREEEQTVINNKTSRSSPLGDKISFFKRRGEDQRNTGKGKQMKLTGR